MDSALQSTSRFLRGLGLTAPALVLDEARVRTNIGAMAAKARSARARFRPHFKTHQSEEIGRWFEAAGVSSIAVSSASMARYFAAAGWGDQTLAILAHPGQAAELDELARTLGTLPTGHPGLGLLFDDADSVREIDARLHHSVRAWVKIDTGYARTGVRWDDARRIGALRDALARARRLVEPGLLTHAGESYARATKPERASAFARVRDRLAAARDALDLPGAEISVGDTPTAASLDDLRGVDELRPGNFVFFDLMQLAHGSCDESQLAVAVACPVLGVYADRAEVVVHGGAVHFSKERLDEAALGHFGAPIAMDASGFRALIPGLRVVRQSQEHGVLSVDPERLASLVGLLRPGDLVAIAPVHACLACDLHAEYVTLGGRRIARRRGGAS